MQPHFLLTKETLISIDKACILLQSKHVFSEKTEKWRIAFV